MFHHSNSLLFKNIILELLSYFEIEADLYVRAQNLLNNFFHTYHNYQ